MTASVPAALRCAPDGSRIAVTRSAMPAISRRAESSCASIVYRLVSAATSPPGRVRASDFTRKWLCMLCRPWLCRGSVRITLENGTLPITRSNPPSGSCESLNDSLRTSASGYSSAAIPAVTGSSSTPSIRAAPGASPRKFPEPHPGSRTVPPSNPSPVTASHIARTIPASV